MAQVAKYKVFFTKQKTQKNKRWADGFVTEGAHGQIKLYDEEMRLLDTDFRRGPSLSLGDEVDFTSYLATIEETVTPASDHSQELANRNVAAAPASCSTKAPMQRTALLGRPLLHRSPKPQTSENTSGNQPLWTHRNNSNILPCEDACQVSRQNVQTPLSGTFGVSSPFSTDTGNAVGVENSLRTECGPSAHRSASQILALMNGQETCAEESSSNTGMSSDFTEFRPLDDFQVCGSMDAISNRREEFVQNLAASPSDDWFPLRSKRQRVGMTLSHKRRPSQLDSSGSNVSESPSKERKQSMYQVPRISKKSGPYIFPSASDCEGTVTCRQVTIPSTFANWHDYAQTFTVSVQEEINLRIRESVLLFFRAAQDCVGAAAGAILCSCQRPAAILTVKKEGANQGRRFAGCAKKSCKFFHWMDVDKAKTQPQPQGSNNFSFDTSSPLNLQQLRQHQVIIYEGELTIQMRYQPKEKKFGPESDFGTSKGKLCFRFAGEDQCKGCSKDDLWILSDSVWFSEDPQASLMFAKSVWFGPSKDNMLELQKLSGDLTPKHHGKTFAMRGPNIGSELDLLENLGTVNVAELPLLSTLLNPSCKVESGSLCHALPRPGRNMKFTITCPDEIAEELVKGVTEEFGLNEEQQSVLQTVVHLLRFPDDPKNCPIVLVHGVFGSGKSTLLVALVILLLRLADNKSVQASQPIRILISAQTNVAVDNILQGLTTRGFEDFVRVGCLKRIAKPILKYTLRESGASEDRIDQESLKDLNDMLKGTRDLEDIRCIRAAILECKEGKMKERKATLNEKRVVGVTCASTKQDILFKQEFPILILDESSQVIEPVLFLPVSRFRSKVLIACGDPKQLPPTITTPSMAESSDEPHDLSKTLFSRLSSAGLKPIMLRRQYRCHPMIGTVASKLFYGGQLINGTSAEDRSALVKGFAPIVFFDVTSGVEVSNETGSFVNNEEARFVKSLVTGIVSAGIKASQVGVICLYKAQVFSLLEMLSADSSGIGTSSKSSGLLVSTVDAFQGGEKDIIIVSCCRTENLGFISSPNRMNVALTRARRHLILVGSGRTLPKNEYWGHVLGQARSIQGGYFHSRDFQMSGFEYEMHDSEEASSQDVGGVLTDEAAAVVQVPVPEEIEVSLTETTSEKDVAREFDPESLEGTSSSGLNPNANAIPSRPNHIKKANAKLCSFDLVDDDDEESEEDH